MYLTNYRLMLKLEASGKLLNAAIKRNKKSLDKYNSMHMLQITGVHAVSPKMKSGAWDRTPNLHKTIIGYYSWGAVVYSYISFWLRSHTGRATFRVVEYF